MKKLHLGCGNIRIPGYINIDCAETSAADMLLNINEIDFYYQPETVDVIYISHVLEHFYRISIPLLLQKFFNILKPGGILRLAVPDWDAVVERYNETKDLDEVIKLIYSNHHVPFDGHYHIWNFDTINRDLLSVGFTNIYKYDWKQTEHSNIDDFSRAYLPHDPEAIKTGNFNNHKLMSLNIEAIK